MFYTLLSSSVNLSKSIDTIAIVAKSVGDSDQLAGADVYLVTFVL